MIEKIVLTIIFLRLMWFGVQPMIGFFWIRKYQSDPRRVDWLEKAIKYAGNTQYLIESIKKYLEIDRYDLAISRFHEALFYFRPGVYKGELFIDGALAYAQAGAFELSIAMAKKAKLYNPKEGFSKLGTVSERADRLIKDIKGGVQDDGSS
jgi:tetratricopeptide (TPR) repeat protein